jgi:hypothetical protein
MAKFSGVIGYAIQVESAPGVWKNQITEKSYRGDVLLSKQRWEKAEKTNDDLNLDNSISIIADAYAYTNSGFMKYIVLQGQKWSIKSLAINRPRIVLQIGGIYNGG